MQKWAAYAGLSVALLAGGGCTDTLSSLTSLSSLSSALTTGSINPPPTSPGFIPGLPAGYQCPLVPNGFDPAGSIYRLDKTGTYYRVKDFSNDPAVMTVGYRKDVPISNYVLSDKQASSAGLSYSLLEKVLPGLTASGSGDLNKEISVDITVEDMVGEVIDDTLADHIVDWFQANIVPKPGSKYFLVRETVKAGSVSYRLKQTDLAKLGGKAEIEKLASGAANVTFHDNDGTFEIKQKFSPARMAVCIKSAEIVIDPKKPSPSGTVSATLKPSDETTVPLIKRVGDAKGAADVD
jgi:hypothetical protein